MSQKRHICVCTPCRAWVLGQYFCCAQHREIMGSALYEEANAVWNGKPFDKAAWGSVLARINTTLKLAREVTNATVSRG